MVYFIGVGNQKGGVGKTLTAIQLSAALAKKGRRVTLIDGDPGAHVTRGLKWSVNSEIAARQERGLPITPELEQWLAWEVEASAQAAKENRQPAPLELLRVEEPTLFKALVPEALGKREAPVQPAQLVRVLPFEGFRLIPCNEECANLEQWLHNARRNREGRLRDFIEQFKKQFPDEDYVVCDSPPNLGPITDNVLACCVVGEGGLLVLVEADSTSVNALETLFEQIDTLEPVLQKKINILGILPNKLEDSGLTTRILTSMKSELISADGDGYVTPIEIRKRVVLKEAYDNGVSIFNYSPEDRHKTKQILEVQEWYLQIADHIEQLVVDGKVKTL